MKQRTKGLIAAMVSSATFGMIPLFSKPALDAGMDTPSLIVYRFLFASIVIYAVMKYYKCDLMITMSHFWRISLLALINLASAITILLGYAYLTSGAATTIQFSYPIFTCLLMMLFFHERPTFKTVSSIILAVIGVALLSGIENGLGNMSVKGVAYELFSGLAYAIYLILVPKMKLDDLESSKLTFWVFVLSFVYMGLITFAWKGSITTPPTVGIGFSIVMLGLIPTAVSNLTLVVGLRVIGSTLTSILGALEPLTAMLVSIFWFCEPFSWIMGVGFICIVVSVTLLILPSNSAQDTAKVS